MCTLLKMYFYKNIYYGIVSTFLNQLLSYSIENISHLSFLFIAFENKIIYSQNL